MHREKAVVVGITAAALLFASLPAVAAPAWLSRPGTVQHTIGEADGSRV